MAYQNLLIVIAFVLLYSLFSKRIEKTVFSGPFLALFVGLIFGPAMLNVIDIKIDSEDYRIIAELALALVLFSDASKTNLTVLKKNAAIPIRLLLIGLPLTILLGMLGGFFLFKDFSWIELGILATMLAPTDAALGKAVVTNPAVPSKIREALNVESGLNDGISVPVLFLFIALFDSISSGGLDSFYGIKLLFQEIGIGLLVGLSVTYVVAKLANYANKNAWISESWQQVVLIALALTCFIVAQISGGSGFIACFAGGFLFGTLHTKFTKKIELFESLESAGDSMSLITWILFSTFLGIVIPQFTWEIVLYALLSLTVIRMLPVMLSLAKTDLSTKESLFIGWFGPRGLATIVFAIIVLDVDSPNIEVILLTTMCTVLFSVVLHGFTAIPFIKRLR